MSQLWERSGSKPSAVNALRKLVELIGEGVQSAASRFDLCSVGKSPEKGRVVGISQSAFFWLSRHGCEPLQLRATGPQTAMFLNRGSVAAAAFSRTEAGCECARFEQHSLRGWTDIEGDSTLDQRTGLQMLDELRGIRSILAQILDRQTEIAQGMMALKQLVAVRSQELARLEGK